jgi:DNA-binding response OmpR family regulator
VRPTLLIADGDPALCDIYQKFITSRGYGVETASDGLDCLAKLQRATPAALLLDMSLLWGGGDGVLAWLREEKARSGVAVVLMAPAGYPRPMANDVQPPVVQILTKPFSLTALLESIRAVMARKVMRSLSN